MPTALNESTPPPPAETSPASRARTKLKELFGVDLRSLALLRMGLGVSVIADVATRAFDLVGLYTDRGVLPRDLLLEMEGRGVYLSAHYWASAHPLLQGGLFAFTILCAFCLLVGWRTRLATLACWYLVASVQIRQPLGYMGGDSILRLLLFWGLFLPLAARFSLDARQGRVLPRPDRFVSGATVALLLQVCVIYWATGIRKTGALWSSGQAIFYALHSHEWATTLGVSLRAFPSLLKPLTHLTLGLERFGPFLAFIPIRTAAFRLATVAIFWGFHVGLATTMNIGLFPLFSMVAWLPFIPTEAWTWVGGAPSPAAEPPRQWPSRMTSIGAAICLAYVLVLVAERTRVIPPVVPQPLVAVGTALRIQQTWNMFAPDPATTTRRHDIQKTMSDGSHVTERAARSFRWTVYLGHAGIPLPPARPLAQSLGRFAQYRCRDARPDDAHRIERIAIVGHDFEIRDDGLSQPTTRTLIDARCPSP